MNNGRLTSKTPEWYTPRDFFNTLNAEFSFTLDPCSTHENAVVPKHFTVEDDGLRQMWGSEVVFMNPPYGRTISAWMRKAYESSLAGAMVCCLVPSRTDVRWWHEYATKGEIRFIRGRLKFGGSKVSAPFPSALIIFRPKFTDLI